MSDSSLTLGSNSTLEQQQHAHESNTGAIIAGLAFLTAVVTVVVVLRLYIRMSIVKKVGIDDYVALVALVCQVLHFYD
jgi:hypothetical protein